MKAAEVTITAMFRAVEFIEQHLKEEISIADVADAVRYSLFHFCRMFNAIVHHTPYDYLMRRRVSESAKDLIRTDQKIIEIAFDYQFNSPETYARAFKRMFGMQPNQCRKQGKIHTRTLMPPLTLAHLLHMNQGEYLKPVIGNRGELLIAGLMTVVRDDLTELIDLWSMLRQELQGIEQSSVSHFYGVTWYPENWEQRGSFYLAGLQISAIDSRLPAFVIKPVPAGAYARFTHKDQWQNRYLTLDYIYHTWLPKSEQQLVYPLEVEYFGRESNPAECEEPMWEIAVPITAN